MILPTEISNHYKQIDAVIKTSPEYKSILEDCIKTFHIFSPDTRKKLENYFLLHWEPAYLLEILEGTDKSYITRNGTKYYVIYMELLSPEYLKEYKRIRVSFRKPEFLDFGFVLVRSFREKTGE